MAEKLLTNSGNFSTMNGAFHVPIEKPVRRGVMQLQEHEQAILKGNNRGSFGTSTPTETKFYSTGGTDSLGSDTNYPPPPNSWLEAPWGGGGGRVSGKGWVDGRMRESVPGVTSRGHRL